MAYCRKPLKAHLHKSSTRVASCNANATPIRSSNSYHWRFWLAIASSLRLATCVLRLM